MIITKAMANEIAKRLTAAAKDCEFEDTPIYFDFQKTYDDIIEMGAKVSADSK